MTIGNLIGKAGRGLAVSAAIAGVLAVSAPQPAHALDTGAAIGLGVGALALGTALGAASNPYYNGYYANPYGYYAAPPAYSYYAPAPTYYAPAPTYYAPTYYNPYYR